VPVDTLLFVEVENLGGSVWRAAQPFANGLSGTHGSKAQHELHRDLQTKWAHRSRQRYSHRSHLPEKRWP